MAKSASMANDSCQRIGVIENGVMAEIVAIIMKEAAAVYRKLMASHACRHQLKLISMAK